MQRYSVKQVLTALEPGENQITVAGWLKTARHGKGDSFLALSDGSCFADLQIVCPSALPGYDSVIAHLGTGCAIIATGKVVASMGQGQRVELLADAIELTGAAGEDYPLQKKAALV